MFGNFIPLYYDQVFIDIFGNKKNTKYLEYLLECILGLEEGSLKNKVSIGFEVTLPRRVDEKTSRCDLIIVYDRNIINLESYQNMKKSSLKKSVKYFAALSNEVLVKKENKYDRVIQINLMKNIETKLPKKFINHQTNNPLQKYMKMLNIRLDELDNFKYDVNKRSKDLRLFCKFISATTKEEQNKIAKESEILMELSESVNEYLEGTSLTRDFFDFDRNTKEAEYEVGYSDGEEFGIMKGEIAGIKKTAKNLLKYGMPIEDIALNTNLSIAEINQLK